MQQANQAAVSTRYFQPRLLIEKISACRAPAEMLPDSWQLGKLLANLLLQGELSDGKLDKDPIVISDLPPEAEMVPLSVLSRHSYPRFLPFQYELFVDCLFRTQGQQLVVYAGNTAASQNFAVDCAGSKHQ